MLVIAASAAAEVVPVMAYYSLRRRIVASCSILAFLCSCSAEGLTPPAEIDGRVRVGSITPTRNAEGGHARQSGYVANREPVPDMPGAVYIDPPGMTASAESGFPVNEPVSSGSQLQQAFPEPVAQASSIPSEGVNMDAGLGVGPVVGLAADQQMEIAEGEAAQPVVDGIGTDSPSLRNQPMRATAPAPQQVAMLMPRNPAQSDAPMRETPGLRTVMPASEASCRAELRRLGVTFRDIASISNGPSCGIEYPIELSGLSGGVDVRPAVKLNCQVTLAFAKWVKYELVPSSRFRYMSGVGRITPMGGYSCRKMNSRSNNPWSEHARGNAIDIGKITLKSGKEIDVRKKGFFAFREKGLLKAVRTDSCKYFSTVLGPGSDPDHWNHFHFDLRTRKTGYRHCD